MAQHWCHIWPQCFRSCLMQTSYPLFTCRDMMSHLMPICPQFTSPLKNFPSTTPWHNFTPNAIVSLTLTSSHCCSWFKPSKCYLIIPGSARTTEISSFKCILSVLLYWERKFQTNYRISDQRKWFVVEGIQGYFKSRTDRVFCYGVSCCSGGTIGIIPHNKMVVKRLI